MNTTSHNIAQMSPQELASHIQQGTSVCVLDVREPWELDVARLENTLNIPMAQVPGQLTALKEQQDNGLLVVMCHSGVRSASIAGFLQQNGFDRVFNLHGGIHAWSEQIDKDVPTY